MKLVNYLSIQQVFHMCWDIGQGYSFIMNQYSHRLRCSWRIIVHSIYKLSEGRQPKLTLLLCVMFILRYYKD